MTEVFEGELVLVNLRSGIYFSAQGAGPAVWQALLDGAHDTEIYDNFLDHFDKREAAESFIADLLTHKLLIESDTTRLNVIPFTSFSHLPKASLEQYTDMQDLLLLDPIHEVDQYGWPVAKRD